MEPEVPVHRLTAVVQPHEVLAVAARVVGAFDGDVGIGEVPVPTQLGLDHHLELGRGLDERFEGLLYLVYGYEPGLGEHGPHAHTAGADQL